MLTHEGLLPSPASRRTTDRPAEPGRAMRALARVRWFSLDGRLAAGEDPAGSRLLAAQAARLTSSRHRELLAAALGGLMLAAEESPRITRVAPSRTALLRNEDAVRGLARRVDSREALYARGLARLERLVTDSTGPVFQGRTAELAHELEQVEGELSGAGAEPLSGHAVRGPSVGQLARLRKHGSGAAGDPAGFAGGSFVLPNGSWFHGRREGA